MSHFKGHQRWIWWGLLASALYNQSHRGGVRVLRPCGLCVCLSLWWRHLGYKKNSDHLSFCPDISWLTLRKMTLNKFACFVWKEKKKTSDSKGTIEGNQGNKMLWREFGAWFSWWKTKMLTGLAGRWPKVRNQPEALWWRNKDVADERHEFPSLSESIFYKVALLLCNLGGTYFSAPG